MTCMEKIWETLAMNLILWRHAEAAPGSPDLARRLTEKGERQAAEMARWLKLFLPKDAKILVSPAQRTRQTADALAWPYELCDDLAPGKSAEQMLDACGWPESDRTVVVVGHNPVIGQAAALIMTQTIADWTIKKGGAWWLANRIRDGEKQVILRAAMSPDLLGVK
jgi:phosphohistidine phosphatase